MSDQANIDHIDYFVDGLKASHQDISGAQYTVVCEAEGPRYSIQSFETRNTYIQFASKGRLSRYLCTSIGREEVLKAMPRTDEVVKHPFATSNLLDGELAELSSRLSGVNAWTRAAQGKSLLEGPLLNSIVLHENRDLSGLFVYIPHWWGTADFSSNHMNDRASCVTLAGSFATLWEDSWFKGRKLDIFLPFCVGFPLWTAGWEDTASSANAWGFW
jgi:hypothetical protein